MADYNSVDKKLQDILRITKNSKHSDENALALAVADRKLESFKFIYQQEPRYTSKDTIRKYVNFAVTIGAISSLGGHLELSNNTLNLTSRHGVLNYLYHQTLEYGENNGVTPEVLRETVLQLHESRMLPTKSNIYSYLKEERDAPISKPEFELFLQLVNIADPDALRISKKWLWLPANTIE